VKEKFSQYTARSEMSGFHWATCPRCAESVVFATVKMKNHSFDPKPVSGGSELDPIYSRHWCAKEPVS